MKRTIQRDDWLLTLDGDRLELGRSEHSIPFEVSIDQLGLLLSDIHELERAANRLDPLADGYMASPK